ncbi:galactose-1-phosphate uridylyltransferase [Hydrogenimonas sp.]
MSEIRYDPIAGEYTLIAPERLRRPDSYAREAAPVLQGLCPFCPGHESMTPPEIFALRDDTPADGPGWRTRVVPNLYKAVQIEAPWHREVRGPYHMWEGLGAHEVIIDTPRHVTQMAAWRVSEYEDWLTTLKARVADLRGDVRLVHVSLFKNHGPAAAATQSHPHTQLIALPTLPENHLRRFRRHHDHFMAHRESLVDAVVAYEKAQKTRLVDAEGPFVAFCPYASAFPFEVAVWSQAPRLVSIDDLEANDITDLARLLDRLMKGLYAQLDDFGFNILFELPPMQRNDATAPFFDDLPGFWRFGLRICPRLYRLGGFELHSGVTINPVAPEEAAQLLRGEPA